METKTMAELETMGKEDLIAEFASMQIEVLRTGRRLTKIQELANQLQLHQIELEMQNRNLREAQWDLEESRQQYADLYDLAPCGYLDLDAKGCIRNINLTGSQMLGIARSSIFQK